MRSMGCERSASSACCSGAARVETVFPHADHDIVAIRLDHFHLSGLEHVQTAAEFGQQTRPLITRRASIAFQLREQSGQQRLALIRSGQCMARPHALQRPAEALLIERLQQVVHGADLERFDCIRIVGGDEDQRRAAARAPRSARDRCRSEGPSECRGTGAAAAAIESPPAPPPHRRIRPPRARSPSASQYSRKVRRPACSSSTMMTSIMRLPMPPHGASRARVTDEWPAS